MQCAASVQVSLSDGMEVPRPLTMAAHGGMVPVPGMAGQGHAPCVSMSRTACPHAMLQTAMRRCFVAHPHQDRCTQRCCSVPAAAYGRSTILPCPVMLMKLVGSMAWAVVSLDALDAETQKVPPHLVAAVSI
jgi:hypothetical protein